MFSRQDQVKLKSGSPILTVTSVIGGRVNVKWGDDIYVRTSSFPKECLVPYEG